MSQKKRAKKAPKSAESSRDARKRGQTLRNATQTAELLGISRQWLLTLAKRGVLPKVNGSYPWPAVRVSFNEYLEGKARETDKPSDWKAERTKLVQVQRRIAELDLGLRRGELLTVEQYEEVVTDAYQRVAQRLKTIAPRLAPDIIGLQTLPEARKVLEVEVRALMQELHGGNGDG